MTFLKTWAECSFAVVVLAGVLLPACSDDDAGSAGNGGSSSSQGGGGTSNGGSSSEGGSGGGSTADGGSSGDGGSGGGMGASQACQTCVASAFGQGTSCEATIQACDADTNCDSWKNCTQDCFNTNDIEACYQACETNFPHDAALSDPLLICLCDACSDVCAAACSIQD